MECRVLFDYKAGEEDELDLKKGDLVSEVLSGGDLEEGWWSGVSGGKRGVFPNNFVEPVPTHPPAPSNSIGHAAPKFPQSDPALRTGVNRTQRAKVTFSYKPVNTDELRLEVGDIVDIFGQVEDGWLSGSNRGARGVFPSNFVDFIDETTLPLEAPPQSGPASRDLKNKVPVGGIALPILPIQGGKPTEDSLKAKKSPVQAERAKVTFSYEPQEEDELKLEVGDIVEVLNKEHAEGWWEGRLNGKTGVFPNNFVELLQKAVLKPTHPARAEDPEPSLPRKASLKGAPATAPKRSGPTNELQRKLDRRNQLNTDSAAPDNGGPVPMQAPRAGQDDPVPQEEQKAPPRRPSGPKATESPDTRRGAQDPVDTRRVLGDPVDTRRGAQELVDTRRGLDPSELEPLRAELSEARREVSDAKRELTKLKQEYREDFDRLSEEAREDRKQLAELKIEVESLKRRRADYWNPEKFF